MENEVLEMTINQFIDALNSASATPSGGSAAALTMAMGFSLIRMSALVSIKKISNEEQLKAANDILAFLDTAVTESKLNIKQDIEAFQNLMAAYRAKDNHLINKYGKEALNSPLILIRVALNNFNKVITLHPYIKPNIYTDYLQGLTLIISGIDMAYINVLINKDSIEEEKSEIKEIIKIKEILEAKVNELKKLWFDEYHNMLRKEGKI